MASVEVLRFDLVFTTMRLIAINYITHIGRFHSHTNSSCCANTHIHTQLNEADGLLVDDYPEVRREKKTRKKGNEFQSEVQSDSNNKNNTWDRG